MNIIKNGYVNRLGMMAIAVVIALNVITFSVRASCSGIDTGCSVPTVDCTALGNNGVGSYPAFPEWMPVCTNETANPDVYSCGTKTREFLGPMVYDPATGTWNYSRSCIYDGPSGGPASVGGC